MTPGPTKVRENVRIARSKETTNPDLDIEFYEYYKETCERLSQILHTSNKSYLLSGEGILGLEAACASLTEVGDRVLVIDNGIFGRGFQDFVTIYGGNPVLFTSDYKRAINIEELRLFLEQDHNFKYATLVHCDTPSGVLNDIKSICSLLKEYKIITVVDAVASMFGEEIWAEESQIDILCGGSQKALSAPVGITMVTISKEAFEAMENRKTPIASFYANLLLFRDYYKNKWFPYTMPISDIYGIRVALENVLHDNTIYKRHKTIAQAARKAVRESGLSLYIEEGFASTVTAIEVPEGIKDTDILEQMKQKYNIMIAGCFDVLAGKVIRIGHMGENATVKDVADTLEALTRVMEDLGKNLDCNMKEVFLNEIKDK